MNTRLLMTLRVSVATAQSIGAVPHGTRRTVPITGGEFTGPRLRGAVLPGGSADWLLLRADGVLELGSARHVADRRRRTHCDEIVRLAARPAGCDGGHGAWRGGRSDSLLFSDDAPVRNRASSLRILEPAHYRGERRPTR
jgi:hypothetical protein